ncbi:hypothetical protein HDV00_007945, partial [Rhizophlyctis rosea]
MAVIVFGYQFQPGRFFWKAHFLGFGLPFAVATAVWGLKEFVNTGTWCGPSKKTVLWFKAVPLASSMIICAVSYGIVIVVLLRNRMRSRSERRSTLGSTPGITSISDPYQDDYPVGAGSKLSYAGNGQRETYGKAAYPPDVRTSYNSEYRDYRTDSRTEYASNPHGNS